MPTTFLAWSNCTTKFCGEESKLTPVALLCQRAAMRRFSREEFERDAIQFYKAFQATALENVDDSSALTKWVLNGDPTTQRSVCLIHPPVLREVASTSLVDTLRTSEYEFEDDALSDPDMLQTATEPLKYEWRFSIVFSDTWMVPVLYFTVTRHLDGTPCLRSEVLDALNVNEHEITDTWDFVSYEEHPITGVPSFFLHPCRTSERLRLLQESQPATAPLLSWATMLLPAVGFRIPTKTFVRVHQWMTDQQTEQENLK